MLLCLMVYACSVFIFYYVFFSSLSYSARLLSITLSSRSLIHFSASSSQLFIPSSVFLISVIEFFICNKFFFMFSISLWRFHWGPLLFSQVQEYLYEYYFKFSIRLYYLSLFHLGLLLWFCSILSFGTHSSVSLFCLTLC